MTELRTSTFPALGTTATVVTEAPALDAALAVVRRELDSVDRACSRFRPDSEISVLNSAAGRAVHVSETFLIYLDAALRAARITDGLVDPTVGTALRLAGYDRDFAEVAPDGPPLTILARPVPGWQAVRVDGELRRVTVPADVELDFGATAKALCADRASRGASEAAGTGVLVSLGGDVAVSGPAPRHGWVIALGDDHRSAGPAPCVSITAGGLATSSTTVRRWRRGAAELHHIIDPLDGRPAAAGWRTASVAAASCLDANIASTAAMLLAEKAPAWLEVRRLPARLVGPDGRTSFVAGWPPDLFPGPAQAADSLIGAP